MSAHKLSAKNADKYLPICLDSLRLDSVLNFDLYTQRGDDMILFRSRLLPFYEKTRQSLMDNNIYLLFVAVDDRAAYQNYIESNLESILHDPRIDNSTKAGMVYDSAHKLVEDVFKNPSLGENIQRSQIMVANTVSFVINGPTAFRNLLDVMSFDYSTYTHSVNVCTFSVALAHFVGIRNEQELLQLGTGALLHDIGKIRVDKSILNKRGSLTEEEFEQIKKHPEWGEEIMRETGILNEESYFPILQHHEREDDSGYPRGLTSEEIHPHAKIVAVADVFDAMTTNRIYREAVSTFPALMVMFGEKKLFDYKLLEHFTKLMGPS